MIPVPVVHDPEGLVTEPSRQLVIADRDWIRGVAPIKPDRVEFPVFHGHAPMAPQGRFKCLWAHTAKMTMPTDRIVELLDVIGDVGCSEISGLVDLLHNSFFSSY